MPAKYFYVDVFDHTWATGMTRFHGYQKLEWEEVLNGIGSGTLELAVNDENLSRLKIQPYNRVRIMYGTGKVWNGYIVGYKIKGQTVTITLRDMFGFTKKRIHTADYADQSILATLGDVLDDINATYDTGITIGSSDAPTTNKAFSFKNARVDSIISQACKSVNADFDIDIDLKLNLYAQKGQVRTSPILSFRDTRLEVTNLASMEVDVNGDDMVNSLTGIAGADEDTQTNTDSRDQFGLLEGSKSYDANNEDTLSSLVENDLDIMSVLDEIPRVLPVAAVAYNAFAVGDTIPIRIDRGFYHLEAGYRVIKKKYSVRITRQHVALEVELAEKPTYVKTFGRAIADIEKRLYNVEQQP